MSNDTLPEKGDSYQTTNGGENVYKKSGLLPDYLRVITLVSLGLSIVIIILGLVGVFEIMNEGYTGDLPGTIICGGIVWLVPGPSLFGANLNTLNETHFFKRWDNLPKITQTIVLLTRFAGAVVIVMFFTLLLIVFCLWSAMSNEGY